AFQAPFRKRTVREVAAEALTLSRMGLRNRRRLNPLAQDECIYLAPLEESVASGRTCADQFLDAYHGRWGGSVDPMFKEFAF
ncbi:MAG: glutamate--cysteine ligase, partial [Hyphomicrobiaceae bacterium]